VKYDALTDTIFFFLGGGGFFPLLFFFEAQWVSPDLCKGPNRQGDFLNWRRKHDLIPKLRASSKIRRSTKFNNKNRRRLRQGVIYHRQSPPEFHYEHNLKSLAFVISDLRTTLNTYFVGKCMTDIHTSIQNFTCPIPVIHHLLPSNQKLKTDFVKFSFLLENAFKSFTFVKIQFLCTMSRPWGLQCEALVSVLLHQFVRAHCRNLKATTLGLHTSFP